MKTKKIKPPQTIEEYQKILSTLKKLQSNPWADVNMIKHVAERIKKVEQVIETLKI